MSIDPRHCDSKLDEIFIKGKPLRDWSKTVWQARPVDMTGSSLSIGPQDTNNRSLDNLMFKFIAVGSWQRSFWSWRLETGYTVLDDTRTSINMLLPSTALPLWTYRKCTALVRVYVPKVTLMKRMLVIYTGISVWNVEVFIYTHVAKEQAHKCAWALFRIESDSCAQSDIYVYISSCVTSE